jgi:hypothetical protein
VVQIWFRHCSSASRTDHFTFLISRSFGFNCFTYSLSEATWPLCDIVGILVQLPGLRYSRCNYPPTPHRRLRCPRRLIGVGHGGQGTRCLIGVGRGAQRIIGDVIRATLLPASQRSLNASHTTALARRLYW